MQIVAVDIGGTHARFAIADLSGGNISLGETTTLNTDDHVSFQAAWEHYRSLQSGELPEKLAMSIAGPVGNDIIQFTNNPWSICPANLRDELGVTQQTLVNDFAAVAHAVSRAPDDQFLHLTGPDVPLPASGTISVIGPGTGLGVGWLWRDGSALHVQATEGGHISFAALDAVDDAILARLKKTYDRVSAERVVSGPAIVDIYAVLAELEGKAASDQDDVAIWTAAQDGSDPIAVAAMERLCMVLGAVAGDTALSQGASSVVIAGGLGYRLRDYLPRSGFAAQFCAKGRFAGLMAKLPVKLITHPQPGLFGAAAAFKAEHGQ